MCQNQKGMRDASVSLAVMDVIKEITGVTNLPPQQDMYDAGVTSIQALPLLMELESRFNVTIPDERFIAARTPNDLSAMISDLQNSKP